MRGLKDVGEIPMTFDDIPWTNAVMKTKTYYVFEAIEPESSGHVVFVPKEQTWEYLADCYKAAYMWGYGWMEDNFCEGFNLVQNVGEAADQYVKYPHVHLVPRRRNETI